MPIEARGTHRKWLDWPYRHAIGNSHSNSYGDPGSRRAVESASSIPATIALDRSKALVESHSPLTATKGRVQVPLRADLLQQFGRMLQSVAPSLQDVML